MTQEEKDRIVQSVPQKGFFGHPKGLFTLFFTEFWERFSYYGMRAILLYYMYSEVKKGGLGMDETTAMSIMAIYGSLVYMSGIIGGWIADRLLGSIKTVFTGGVLIMLGHICLAMPFAQVGLFASMFLIIMGTGLLKPNVSNIVGDIYSDTDTRRDSGFSIFYMGINLGAFISPLIVGTLGQKYNYHLGFSLAAIGMLLGLIVFAITKKKALGLAGTHVPNPLMPGERKKVFSTIGISTVVIVLLCWFLASEGWLTINRFITAVSILAIIIPAAYFFFMYRSPKTNADERSRLLAYIPLFIGAMMFWAIQEQGSIILAQYADKRTELNWAGIHIESSWFQSLNPLFIVGFAPVFAWLWMKMGDRQPSTSKKFSIGLLFAGLSFLVMMIPGIMNGTDELANPWWLVLSFFLVVIGELCLSPVGLAATTKLAPAAFSAQTMSLWFLTNASAQAINANIVKLFKPETEILYFGVIGGFSILLAVILYILSPKLQKAMRGVN
ncbi:peptide MFS transporter [Bacillus sp. 1P06AnD]|uniref:peptide MFS transporter n=1 Tax=Bacillus sp. 1P06AnD TaxID=3132208 RepID=UPI0039A299B7